jgi:Carboxypeptidase regulatory-like domain
MALHYHMAARSLLMRRWLPAGILLWVCVANLAAQTPGIRGRIADSAGAGMTATIRAYQGTSLIRETKASLAGDFELMLPAGEYRLEVTAEDFATHTETVQVVPGLQPLKITMTLAVIATSVEVTATQDPLELSLDSSLGTTTLSGDKLTDLPDDEELLAEYLQQLTEGTGSTEAAQFVVDGFANGRLPPKDQIQQIIIENNPFGAEGRGGPRVRIITRPGTGAWRGSFGFGFQDESLNARNPFSADKPASQRRSFNPNFTGPLIPGRVTLNLSASNTESESEGGALRAITPFGTVSSAVVSPTVTRSLQPRFTIQLSQRHRMNLNLRYNRSKRDNQGIGGFNLPERASNSRSTSWRIEASETATLGSRMTNELRFQFGREISNQTPVNNAIAINVLDAFRGGGAQNRSRNRDTEFSLANQIRASSPDGKWRFNTGIELERAERYSYSENNYLGTYTFSSLHDYCISTDFDGINCEVTKALIDDAKAQGIEPLDERGRPITGIPVTFTQTSGDPEIQLWQTEFTAFLETTLRMTPRLQMQMNLRYQAQTHLDDFNNVDPRINVSYQLFGVSRPVAGQPRPPQPRYRTFIRFGSGIFHQGFDIGNYEQLLRNNGTSRQYQTVVSNPDFNDPFGTGSGSVTSRAQATSITTRSVDFVGPYRVRSQVALEQSLPWQLGFTLGYTNERGLHQQRTRNINGPLPLLMVRPEPSLGNIQQFESRGKSWSHRVNFSVRQRIRNENSLWGLDYSANYTLGWAMDDAGRPMDNYNLAADWGRASSDQRHSIRGNIRISGPRGISISLTPTWGSGQPYTITTGHDDNGDTEVNDRPAGVARNSENGPSRYNVDMNLSKRFTLFDNQSDQPDLNGLLPLQRGDAGPGVGQRPGTFPRGGPGRRNQTTMTFSINVRNLLNNTQLQNYSGVLTSPFFGKANRAANGRTVALNLRFNF